MESGLQGASQNELRVGVVVHAILSTPMITGNHCLDVEMVLWEAICPKHPFTF